MSEQSPTQPSEILKSSPAPSPKVQRGFVLVVGGAGGIGQSIIRLMLEYGYEVLCLDRNGENIQDAAQKFPGVSFEQCDILDIDNLIAIRENMERTQGLDKDFSLDHIVCLAGGATEGEWIPFDEQDVNEITNSIKINLFGCINIMHTFLPLLEKSPNRKRSIVLVSSINALRSFGLPGYSAAKAGRIGLVNALSGELGDRSIRINALSPGTVPTPRTQTEPKDFEALLKTTLLNRFATTDNVAEGVLMLLENEGITAQNLIIDAGQSAK